MSEDLKKKSNTKIKHKSIKGKILYLLISLISALAIGFTFWFLEGHDSQYGVYVGTNDEWTYLFSEDFSFRGRIIVTVFVGLFSGIIVAIITAVIRHSVRYISRRH